MLNYSANELNNELTTYLEKPSRELKKIRPKAIIAPHAGYYYSGPTAAWSYQYLQKLDYVKRVFIFGPSHHKYFPGCTLTYVDQYDTPLGPLEIDIESKNVNMQLWIN